MKVHGVSTVKGLDFAAFAGRAVSEKSENGHRRPTGERAQHVTGHVRVRQVAKRAQEGRRKTRTCHLLFSTLFCSLRYRSA